MRLSSRILVLAVLGVCSGADTGPTLSPLDPEDKVALRDHPVGCRTVRYLDSADGQVWWAGMSVPNDASVTNETAPLRVLADVPGDIISDLHAAGVIGNPLYEFNFKNSSLWLKDWTYSANVTITEKTEGTSLLVFDGVKMGAEISVNGVVVGNATDQFLRYQFDVSSLLVVGNNSIEVAFRSEIDCNARWMACTGGWDWAPYSGTSQEGAATFSKGIWKSVYLAVLHPEEAAVMHLVPQVFYNGAYPSQPLTSQTTGDFEVRTRVHLWTPPSSAGSRIKLSINGSWGAQNTTTITAQPGDSNVTLVLAAPKGSVALWWPVGSGEQPMYVVSATASKPTQYSTEELPYAVSSRSVAFRTVALVTGNDTDPDYVSRAANEEGTELHGMLFRINGAVIFCRGANVVPMDEMEGWLHAGAHREMVSSSVNANFNMLRVWGGGMFLPEVFYDACDEAGILIYHDMQYAQNGHAPQNTITQRAEIQHQVRRLSHHPSIVLIDGCNECTVVMTDPTTSIYATFVLTVLAEEDASRPIWPSCPAKGWSTGVHKLTSMPNGNPLTTPDTKSIRCSQIPGALCVEVHRPKWLGSGFTAVNGHSSLSPGHANMPWPWLWWGEFPSSIPLQLSERPLGPQFRNNFSSESPGATVMSSFESMSPTLHSEHWGLHGGAPEPASCSKVRCSTQNAMSQRNYPCDSEIIVYFGNTSGPLTDTGEQAFKRQLFYCMIAQGLVVKQNIEDTRAQNRFGTLVWQLNEIWPTGGWGSLEYGNPRFPGQVLGGRWKPLHYWYRQSIFADVLASCDTTGLCYVKNDRHVAFTGTLTINHTEFTSLGVPTTLHAQDLKLSAGAGVIQWIHVPQLTAVDGTRGIVEAIVTDAVDGSMVSTNLIPFATPGQMRLLPANATVQAETPLDVNEDWVAKVFVEHVSLYLTLTTLTSGRFETNAVLIRPPGRQIKFLPSVNRTEAAFEMFARSLRVEDVSRYRFPAK